MAIGYRLMEEGIQDVEGPDLRPSNVEIKVLGEPLPSRCNNCYNFWNRTCIRCTRCGSFEYTPCLHCDLDLR